MAKNRPLDNVTQRIASEAARIAAEFGTTDLGLARRKAASRLGVQNQRQWPKLEEVEAALRIEQQLFHAHRQPEALSELRLAAAKAMRLLQTFQPRLTGPVLDGTADEHSPITLLLNAETPEEVIFLLTDNHIPWYSGETRVYLSRQRQEVRPTLNFQAGAATIELIVLSPDQRSDPLFSPDGNHPLRVEPYARIEPLLQGDDPEA